MLSNPPDARKGSMRRKTSLPWVAVVLLEELYHIYKSQSCFVPCKCYPTIMVQFSVLNFIKSQWTPVPPAPKVDLHGQTVVVVGANTGIGFEAATHFARMGPGRLILACRSLERGSVALASQSMYFSV